MNNEKSEKLVHELIEKIDQHPDVAGNYYALAMLLVEGDNVEQAEELLLKARGLFNDEDDYQLIDYGLGNVYYSSGLYEKANEIFQKIKNPKLQSDANLMIAQGYFAQEQYQKAFAYALTAHEMNPKNADITELMGDINLALGLVEDAKESYDEALNSKRTAKLLFSRGLVEMVLTDNVSNEYFVKSKKLDKEYFEIHKQRLDDIGNLVHKEQE